MSESNSGKSLEKVLKQLNPEQKLAVNTIEGPLLIVAGAGSGKTGVITARIAWMLNQGIPQSNILALTFTNKAAGEMQERVKDLLRQKLSNLTVSTFHAFGVRILNEQGKVTGLRPKFTIYDLSEKISTLKKAARELKINYELSEINALANLFSGIKTRRMHWDEINSIHKPMYDEYTSLMRIHNAVDFDDLIVEPLKLFENDEAILNEYSQRYRYIMVDEFQDTSAIQYQLVKLLGEKHRNLCCVGDDDQSIYSWRGADFTNILSFEKDFPDLQEIKMERNYRSTGTILKAANAVIANNSDRKNKNLWTHNQHEEMTIQFMTPENEIEEAESIAETIISSRIEHNISYGRIGILVRTNTLMRSIETALLSSDIPYSVSGGTSFYSRQEIKDIIAYLRVIDNPDDDVNFLRIINTPRRGIGKSTLEIIVKMAGRNGHTLYSTASSIVFSNENMINEKTRAGLAEFVDFIEQYRSLFSRSQEKKTTLASLLKEIVEEIEYWSHLSQEFQHNSQIAKWRYENIQSFISQLEQWESHPDNLEPTLTRWLNLITLNAREQFENDDAGKVNLMTIHASKGLEFDVVFLPGMENGILPHARSLEVDARALEEERRLFYVAITRARSKLYLSSCQTRKIRQESSPCQPSPFLEEIPRELIENAVTDNTLIEGEDVSRYFAKMPWR